MRKTDKERVLNKEGEVRDKFSFYIIKTEVQQRKCKNVWWDRTAMIVDTLGIHFLGHPQNLLEDDYKNVRKKYTFGP